MVGGDLGGDDEAADLERLLACSLIVAADAEEDGDGLGSFDVEELAYLGLFAEVLVEVAEDVGHCACFGGLAGDLAVHYFAAAGRVDGFEFLGWSENSAAREGEKQCKMPDGEIAMSLRHGFHLCALPGGLVYRRIGSGLLSETARTGEKWPHSKILAGVSEMEMCGFPALKRRDVCWPLWT